MKKSKIIVPALAVLCLSTAAAVSGTVAWFSAARNATIESTSTVINPEGTLKVELEALAATKISGAAVLMDDNSVLRDASVDVASDPTDFTAYRAILGASQTPTGYEEVTADDMYEITVGQETTKTKVYYYASFKASFAVNGASADNHYDVFFDAAKSLAAAADQFDTVQNGYRVAMISSEKETPCVWAPKSASATVTYVNGTDATHTYTKASGSIDNTSTQGAAEDSALWLGTINGSTALDVTFVIWYEGSDASVITANLGYQKKSTAKYTMSFNAVEYNDFAK